jgi:putative nucleotidyltransferase-like protein
MAQDDTAETAARAASRAALLLWQQQGRWADVALEGASMDPVIRDGATLRVRFGRMGPGGPGSPGGLAMGDVVLFLSPAGLIAHRVIRVGRRGRRAGMVRVKGDPLTSRKAAWIRADEVLGRVAAVTQPDGARLYLNTPAGRLLNRAAAWISTTLGAIDARLPRRRGLHPADTMTGRALKGLVALHGFAQRRLERDAGRLLTPEDRFLVLSCRPRLRPGDLAPIAAAAAEVLDWDLVREHAVSLGLAPLLHRNLADPTLARICPEAFLARLARASHLSACVTIHQRQELARVLERLNAAGLEPLLLKGAALAATVYDDPTVRTMNDLDLLGR